MGLSTILCFITAASAAFSLLSGGENAFGSTILDGAGKAVELLFTIAGQLSLWCGLGTLSEKTGLWKGVEKGLRPVIRKIFPSAEKDGILAQMLSANLCMNLFGLGNAATPMGIRAVQRLQKSENPAVATDEMCRLVVLNTASVQLLPTTVAAIRSGAGAVSPFDILPCVWITSLCSVGAGLLAAFLLGGHGRG